MAYNPSIFGRSPLGVSQLDNILLQAVKKEVNSQSPPATYKPGKTGGTTSGHALSTPKHPEPGPSAGYSCFNPSPPIFSMAALTDVLGDCVGNASQEERMACDPEGTDQKFNMEEMSMIEQNADSFATALFNATQTLAQQQQDSLAKNQNELTGLLEAAVRESEIMSSPAQPVTSLLQLEHPLLEGFLSPTGSSQCESPIYSTIALESGRKRKSGYEGGEGSSDSGSECSDSDYELDGESSAGSEESSDSDFDADDSDSDFGGRRKRGGGACTRKYNQVKRRGYGKVSGVNGRKQPYHHHKSSKNKEQVVMMMGSSKPLATRQISAHQLEAIAATMGSSPVTVNWLLQNYETSEGNSLPRALMYGHYLRHCAELRLDPVNAASFGKLIRSVFVGLTTRRLGTRGNSKYHYCGIRIKDTSTLLLEDPDLSKKTRTNGKRSKKTQILAMQGVGICGLGGNKGLTLEVDSAGNIDVKGVKKYLGAKCDTFPEIAMAEFYMPEGVSYQDLLYFTSVYKNHCRETLLYIESFQLNELGPFWHRFWQERGETTETDSLGLSKEILLRLTMIPEVQFAVQNLDAFMYDQILSILMPNVIAQLPFQLMQEYQNFSLTLHSHLTSALMNFDPTFTSIKLQVLDSFINELKSWISLNLSAQAARDSMQSPNSIAQLLSDLNRINFRSVLMDVKEYVNVDEMDINVHESLKRILSGPDSIEPWSVWLVSLVEQRIGMNSALKAAENEQDSVNAIIKECQDLSLRWLKYMSQLKLELLLRSSGSLSTFLSLELLFSNFLLHLIKVYKSRALQVPLVLYSIVRNGNLPSSSSPKNNENLSAQIPDGAVLSPTGTTFQNVKMEPPVSFMMANSQ